MKSGLEKRCRDARNTTQGHAAARTGRYSELARVVDVFVPARQDRSGGQVLRNGRPGRMPQMQHQPRQRQRVFQPVLSRNLCQTRRPAPVWPPPGIRRPPPQAWLQLPAWGPRRAWNPRQMRPRQRARRPKKAWNPPEARPPPQVRCQHCHPPCFRQPHRHGPMVRPRFPAQAGRLHDRPGCTMASAPLPPVPCHQRSSAGAHRAVPPHDAAPREHGQAAGTGCAHRWLRYSLAHHRPGCAVRPSAGQHAAPRSDAAPVRASPPPSPPKNCGPRPHPHHRGAPAARWPSPAGSAAAAPWHRARPHRDHRPRVAAP